MLLVLCIPPILRIIRLFGVEYPNILRTLFIAVGFLLTVFISIRNPEVVYLTKYQLIKAGNVYKLIERVENMSDFPIIDKSKISKYIKSIQTNHPELFEKDS